MLSAGELSDFMVNFHKRTQKRAKSLSTGALEDYRQTILKILLCASVSLHLCVDAF